MAINKVNHKDVEQFAFLASHSVEFDAMSRYQELATLSAIYPGQGTPLGLAYVALKMNGEAGEFAEHVGKAMRDDDLLPLVHADVTASRTALVGYLDSDLTISRRELLIKEIGDVLWYLSAACNELGISLSDAAVTNLRKLADRSERGKLQGSGDDR
jgi:NTP pyrophosphatase (non-canonical NTP hydrolase)